MCFGCRLDDGKTQARASGRGTTRPGLVRAEESFERARSVEISEAGSVVLYFQHELAGAFTNGDANVPTLIRELQRIVREIPGALAEQAWVEDR